MTRSVTGAEIGGGIYPAWNKTLSEVKANSLATASFQFRTNLKPGTYFLNAGVRGVNATSKKLTYLHRVIDAIAFRIQEIEEQEFTGNTKLVFSTDVAITNE